MTPCLQDLLRRAVETLHLCGVVAVPTDTLVGLLALARDARAVDRVLAIKGPSRKGPIPVLVPDLETALSLTTDFSARAFELAEKGWPGPLTLVLNARVGLPEALTASGPTIGLRVPGPSPARDLVCAVGEPLTGTSANRSGCAAVCVIEDLAPEVVAQVDFVLPGSCPMAVASTVIDLTGDVERILRSGPITSKDFY